MALFLGLGAGKVPLDDLRQQLHDGFSLVYGLQLEGFVQSHRDSQVCSISHRYQGNTSRCRRQVPGQRSSDNEWLPTPRPSAILTGMATENVDPVYSYIDRYIDTALQSMKDNIQCLQEQVLGLQRTAVRSRAVLLSQRIAQHRSVAPLSVSAADDSRRAYKDTMDGVNDALATLRGRLAEEALPEDAYSGWLLDVRTKLLAILKPADVDDILSGSAAWEATMGFA